LLATLALGWPLLLVRAVFGFAMGIALALRPRQLALGIAEET